MQGPSCLSQTHGTLLIPPSCPHRAQERDPLLQVRLQHHTTRLFVGHSLVVGGMSPCACNLCKQVVHTHTQSLSLSLSLSLSVSLCLSLSQQPVSMRSITTIKRATYGYDETLKDSGKSNLFLAEAHASRRQESRNS